MKPNDIMSKAINGLMKAHPFYASILLKHKLVWDETEPTGYTDGVTLGTNAKWFSDLPERQRMTYLAHEVEHVCKLHHTRRGARDAKQWNKAADYAINSILVDAGFEPIANWLYNAKYKGMSAEAIYRALQNEQSKQGKQPQQSQGQGKQGQGTQGQTQGTPTQGQGQNPLPSPSQANGTPKNGLGQPGNGIPEEGETVGTVRDASDKEKAEQAATSAVNQAKGLAKRIGKLSGATERGLANVSQRIDPREAIAAFITERARSNYTMRRPHRKYMIHEIYQPSLYNEALGRFAIACDTSGSISAEEIQKLLAFVFSCLSSLSDYGAQDTLPVIYCDAEIKRIEELGPDDIAHPIGGGGTDFKPPFKYIEDGNDDVIGMLYITDGLGPFPTVQPDYPVIWGLLRPYNGFAPPFGEVIELYNMV